MERRSVYVKPVVLRVSENVRGTAKNSIMVQMALSVVSLSVSIGFETEVMACVIVVVELNTPDVSKRNVS